MTAKQILKIRTSRNWSQREMADFLCVSQVAVSHWERGERNPSGPILKLLKQLQAEQKK